MLKPAAILLAASFVGGCAYFPTPPDPIRIVDSPADVFSCVRLGPVSGRVPTNGTAPVVISSLTVPVPAAGAPGVIATGAPPSGPGFVYAVNAMRDRALSLGATDLLLRRVYRDWSVVEGIAYRCRR